MEEIKAIIQEKLAQKQKEVELKEKSIKDNGTVVDKDNTLSASDSDSSDDTLTDSDSSYTTDSGQDERTGGQTDRQEMHDYSVTDISQNNNMKTGICFINNGTNTGTSDSEIQMPVPLSPAKSITRKIANKDFKSETASDTHSLLKKLSQSSSAWFGSTRESVEAENFRLGQTHSAFTSEKLSGNAEEVKMYFANMPQLNSQGETEDDASVGSAEGKDQNKSESNEEDEFDDEEEWTDTAPKIPNRRGNVHAFKREITCKIIHSNCLIFTCDFLHSNLK